MQLAINSDTDNSYIFHFHRSLSSWWRKKNLKWVKQCQKKSFKTAEMQKILLLWRRNSKNIDFVNLTSREELVKKNKLARPIAIITMPNTDLKSWVLAGGDVMEQSAPIMFNFTERKRIYNIKDGNSDCLLGTHKKSPWQSLITNTEIHVPNHLWLVS